VSTYLHTAPLPPLTEPDARPDLPRAEFDARIDALLSRAGSDWVIVYGDREHAANLVFMTGLDPRFEEALLVLGANGTRALVLGNEGMGYTSQAEPKLEFVLGQSLGLMGQSRAAAPRIDHVLAQLGIRDGQHVAVVGWKYLEAEECDPRDFDSPAFVPAFLTRMLERLTGPRCRVSDATRLLMHPVDGLKSHNSAAQLAQFEWAAMLSSNAVHRVVRGARPGQSEAALAARLFEHNGAPYACHPMLNSAGPDQPVVGLRSAGPRVVNIGDGMACAVGYWGGLCARAGLLVSEPDADFLTRVVQPYFAAIATWWQTLRIGVSGGEIYEAVHRAIGDADWRPALNPGHLISIDEWTHTPIREDSADALTSGMALQCDIIPAPMPNGWALNCEDGVALADAALRAELAAQYPAMWLRIQARRAWMREHAGITLADEVLPLSNAAGCLAPFWRAPDLVCHAAAVP
jgi:hypothetical protein